MKKGVQYIGLALRFTGLRAAALDLEVHEMHLRKVLQEYHNPGCRNGRKSASLIARVRASYPALLGLGPARSPAGRVKP